MKKTLLLAMLAVLAFTAIPSDLFGQAQIYTRKEKLKDLTAKTVKVVMTGDEVLDQALKQSVTASWNLSPYEFCSNEEFQKLKSDNKFYFLIVVKGQQRKEAEPGIDLLTLVKGGEGSDKSIEDMFEVVTFPLRAAVDPSGREYTFLPAFLTIMQEHAKGLTDSEVKAYSTIGASDTKKLRMKQIFICEDDLAPDVGEKTLKSLDEDIFIKDDDEDVDEIFIDGKFNAVVSYVVAPTEPVNGSVCYKMLIGADDHKLYWFKKHRISARQGAGFLESDLKAIKLLRK
ncbi:MAG: hypothetical protein J6L98_05560 [Bacteroidales bacterium]|nr:hypothetical protein [Bacteroidales bacterium]